MAQELMDMTVLTATVLLALLFAHAAWHKVSDYGRFLGYVINYRLLPEWAAGIAANALILAEGLFVLLLLYPATSSLGATGLAALLLLYAAAMAVSLFRGRAEIECGCGGSSHPVSWLLVLRNLALASLAVMVALQGVQGVAVTALFVALLAGIGLWLIYNLFGKLAENHRMLVAQSKS
ncbi:MauE/DoxX family redox-associated membrane protein [Marinobacter sp. F3R11]|uniref:MauE/DoxX family redox-associated membrane protein n=1 Tax=Marinobacter sp. F3R11 TaxID=2267231 RepID=UPI000DE82AED|nr:MauE/DoxX family redox-associated membrane protein [Marinobacter sp. F3R11]RBW51229.1 methylamine utilization protein MauE [Marinobacter sp. F3R11]